MGIASLVLGIVSLIMSCIPIVGVFFCVTAIMGIVLGIISLCRKQEKGKSIAGIVTSSLAIVIMIIYMVFIVVIFGGENGLIAQIEKGQESNIPEVKECVVGETLKNDNMNITFVSADENFKGYSEYAKIEPGYKIIRAEFEFQNVGTSNQYISSYNFDCYADGYDCDSFWSVEDSSFSTTLSSGKRAKGIVYFEVPENSENIVLEYNVNNWNNSIMRFIVK